MLVEPFLDDTERGLFARRHPCRSNPLGLSIVRLTGRQGSLLTIEGVDVLAGTPLLDLKPYVPDFDAYPAARAGWYERRSQAYARLRGAEKRDIILLLNVSSR